ncbi:hypothetical protein GWK36_00610 [Caldichromatium japonicum]|uniref:Toxin CptA n=1 Tax=Caldichromatium japonicum TaxID=2699430 RepID=A0A6G7VAD2_9GAMM|nr:protein YgfX [Caldichromatium japonicum]QIK36747.1 hypothetical protein GWK36_00610 [Caldichromatium japonicum]
MDRPTDPPLILEPRPSRLLLLFACLTHLLAAAVSLALPLGGWQMALVVLLSLGKTLWADVLRRAPWSIRAATWNADGTWSLRLADGRMLAAQLAPASFIGLHWVSLVFITGRRRRTLVLTADVLEVDTLRRLRQRLRLRCGMR